MGWDEGQTMQARFEHAAQAGQELHAHWKLGDTYGGFTAALKKRSSMLADALKQRFQQQMHRMAGQRWLCRGWALFAGDGTRIETPHTSANELGLGCAGREKSAPQVFLTSLWHLGLGLPWDFRTGPGTDSERRHLEEMVAALPQDALVVADAGFCGFELCRTMRRHHVHFLLRVGGNVTLLQELGYAVEQRGNTVYLWPENQRNQSPLVLRLITLSRGKQTVYLVTSVLDEEELSDEDAEHFYELRWSIEVGYRSYKQTLDRRRMLSRTPLTCVIEAQWTLLGLWLLGLLCMQRQRTAAPRSWSPAKARDVVRRVLRRPACRCRATALDSELQRAVYDQYVRHRPKTARNYPRKKREKPPGPPKIKQATPHQVRVAQKIRAKLSAVA
jgi:Transposase DDE domain